MFYNIINYFLFRKIQKVNCYVFHFKYGIKKDESVKDLFEW